MASYHLQDYWNKRYQQDAEPFEWYQRYEDLRGKIVDLLPESSRCLVVGGGSSEFSFSIHDDPEAYVKDVVTIDFSPVVVKRMQTLVGDRKAVSFAVMDACEMTFPDASFELVVDKGTLDSILCGEDAKDRSTAYLDHVFRVLKPFGLFLCVSYANRDMREMYFAREALDWDIEVREVPKPKLLETQTSSDDCHYIYILRKRGEPTPDAGAKGAKGKK